MRNKTFDDRSKFCGAVVADAGTEECEKKETYKPELAHDGTSGVG
jgi:hypothetical protein